MSKLLFIRSYFMIVMLIFTVGWGLDKLLIYYSVQENSESNETQLKGSFLYIESILNQQNTQAIWAQKKVSIQGQLGYPVALYQQSDFSNEDQLIQVLFSGEIVAMSTENESTIFYRKLKNSDDIIALGPIKNWGTTTLYENYLIPLYYLLVAGAIFLWLWPLYRDLHELRKATNNFGEENFIARVNLAKTSSIGSVAAAFNSMAQRIQDLVSAHEELTHAVSHELKTPLARFKFSLEIMSDLDDSEQRDKYLLAMKEDVRELDNLIDEMLSYAKLGAHNLKLNFRRINIKSWVAQIISQYDRGKIDIKLIFTSNRSEKEIIIDRHLMDRAINNLIRNGLRYAKSELRISLSVIDKQVNLQIEDDGIGIPEQSLEHIFQPFTRLDTSRDRQSGGYGLGLSITQKILQQHKGRISAGRSSIGGAVFYLTWPISPYTSLLPLTS